MKILITGSTGLLGHRVVELALEAGHEVLAAYRSKPLSVGKAVKLDLLNLETIKQTIVKLRPEAIVHAAAYTDVDGCETNRELAWKVNTEATKQIALAAADIGAHLTYVSTDYVFDGEMELYKEEDKPNPINHYGYTKLEGEKLIQANSDSWCIARASVIYGWGGGKKNFATWLIDSLSAGTQVKVLTDQYVSPTLNTNLSNMLLEIVKRRLTGILHTAGASRVSRYDFAIELAKVFRLDLKFIKQAKMGEMTWDAKRPRDSSLDVSRCMALLNSKPLEISEALTTMMAQR